MSALNTLVKTGSEEFVSGQRQGCPSGISDFPQQERFTLVARGFRLNLGGRTQIMGIVNLTPDSFSGDGLYRKYGSNLKQEALRFVEGMLKDGADIIDIGGESSRPGARRVTVKEELNRVIPVIKFIAKKINKPISIDTYKPKVAEAALDCGASIINDITALSSARMRKVAAKSKAAVVLMHIKGTPRTMQRNPRYDSLIEEILNFLQSAVLRAQEAGISRESIVIDPGIGFGKTPGHNLEIISRLKEFKRLHLPIMVGPSRKSFIGHILKLPVEERIFGTSSAVSACILNGACIVRVHDVKQMRQTADLIDAIKSFS